MFSTQNPQTFLPAQLPGKDLFLAIYGHTQEGKDGWGQTLLLKEECLDETGTTYLVIDSVALLFLDASLPPLSALLI